MLESPRNGTTLSEFYTWEDFRTSPDMKSPTDLTLENNLESLLGWQTVERTWKEVDKLWEDADRDIDVTYQQSEKLARFYQLAIAKADKRGYILNFVILSSQPSAPYALYFEDGLSDGHEYDDPTKVIGVMGVYKDDAKAYMDVKRLDMGDVINALYEELEDYNKYVIQEKTPQATHNILAVARDVINLNCGRVVTIPKVARVANGRYAGIYAESTILKVLNESPDFDVTLNKGLPNMVQLLESSH